jgi:hypothetical protein
MQNRFAGNCVQCGERVEPGKGHPEKLTLTGRGLGPWGVRCFKCVGKKRRTASEPRGSY